jgi:hypothetical protein
MKLAQEQRKKIINLFPKQRGNVKVDNSRFPDAIIYIGEKTRPTLYAGMPGEIPLREG